MIPDIAFLQKIYIFQDLNDEEIEHITRILTPRDFQADETIMKEGEAGESMYVIAAGEVSITKALTMRFGKGDYRETEKTMSKLAARDYAVFGEMALITEDVRSATIVALTDCTLYEIKRDDFMSLARGEPELGFKIMLRLSELLSKRLKKTGEDVIRLSTALSIALRQ